MSQRYSDTQVSTLMLYKPDRDNVKLQHYIFVLIYPKMSEEIQLFDKRFFPISSQAELKQESPPEFHTET